MDNGVYCLILECIAPVAVCVGALGPRCFVLGWYLYIGSALGSGGLSRVSRHIRFYCKQYRKPKWHIDYLMEADCILLRRVVCAKTKSDLECLLAATIGGEGVPQFGCSDCSCPTHLFYRKEMPEIEVMAAFETIGLQPSAHTIPGGFRERGQPSSSPVAR
ncbi:MAG: GIY-YIG nuclease family protein [Methanocalculaceae archaeon]|jgi:Uri superfamily endonuclease|nr:GIY-YIG nuclease family protein [Methanocalculaceae archaeon]